MGYSLVSHEWIYRHVERDKAPGGELYQHLRHQQKHYRKRYGSQERRGRIIGRIGIEERSSLVEERVRIGDWEGDTIRGKGRSALVDPGGAKEPADGDPESGPDDCRADRRGCHEGLGRSCRRCGDYHVRQWQGVRLPQTDR